MNKQQILDMMSYKGTVQKNKKAKKVDLQIQNQTKNGCRHYAKRLREVEWSWDSACSIMLLSDCRKTGDEIWYVKTKLCQVLQASSMRDISGVHPSYLKILASTHLLSPGPIGALTSLYLLGLGSIAVIWEQLTIPSSNSVVHQESHPDHFFKQNNKKIDALVISTMPALSVEAGFWGPVMFSAWRRSKPPPPALPESKLVMGSEAILSSYLNTWRHEGERGWSISKSWNPAVRLCLLCQLQMT